MVNVHFKVEANKSGFGTQIEKVASMEYGQILFLSFCETFWSPYPSLEISRGSLHL
jgi:hypothetical protein